MDRKGMMEFQRDTFKTHTITKREEVGDVKYFTLHGDTSFHWFRLLLAPGVVVVYGDIGDGIFYTGGDSLQWILNLRDEDSGYALRKMKRPQYEFSAEYFIRCMDMLREDDPELYIVIDKEWRKRTEDVYEGLFPSIWAEIWSETCGGIDVPDVMDYDSECYWLFNALITFKRCYLIDSALEDKTNVIDMASRSPSVATAAKLLS
jgi:hypothetical protein